MLRALPVLLELGLTIFCLIDCLQSDERDVRNLPRWAWLLLVLLFPIVGGIAWLVAGRPLRGARPAHAVGDPDDLDALGDLPGSSPRHAPRPIGPDDDPAFLRELGRVNDEHEQTLKRWEADLARREEELRRRQEQPPEG